MQYKKLSYAFSVVVTLSSSACTSEAGTEAANSQAISENLGRFERRDESAAGSGGSKRRSGWRSREVGSDAPVSSESSAAGNGGSRRSRRSMGGAGAAGSTTAGGAGGTGGAAGSVKPPIEQPPSLPVDAGSPVPMDAEPQPSAARWSPAPNSSWQIQFTGKLDTSVNASVYDLDLFDTSAAQIAQLHAAGRKVICYFDTAYEPGRPDSAQLAPYKGNPISGWPGQYWLDVRQPAVLEVMQARIAQAKAKGCDAVDADDIDARSNNPGFSISAQEQRAFVRALADAAHAAGMSFGMKNALEDVSALIDAVDFAVNEQCFEYAECDALKPFTAAGKAVFHIEYTESSLESKGADVCPKANALGFSTLIKRMDLNAERYACR